MVQEGQTAALRVLGELGADLDIATNDGATPGKSHDRDEFMLEREREILSRLTLHSCVGFFFFFFLNFSFQRHSHSYNPPPRPPS